MKKRLLFILIGAVVLAGAFAVYIFTINDPGTYLSGLSEGLSMARSVAMAESGGMMGEEEYEEDEGYDESDSPLFEYDDSAGGIVSRVRIDGYYQAPPSLAHEGTIVLDGLSDGEFVEIVIEGEIYDFQHLEVSWNENGFTDIRVIHAFDKLTNATVVIKTYMPEGAPCELIRWKGANGEVHEFVIAEYGMGD